MLFCLLPSPDTSHPLTKLMANIPMVAVAKTAHCSVAQSFHKQPRTQAHLRGGGEKGIRAAQHRSLELRLSSAGFRATHAVPKAVEGSAPLQHCRGKSLLTHPAPPELGTHPTQPQGPALRLAPSTPHQLPQCPQDPSIPPCTNHTFGGGTRPPTPAAPFLLSCHGRATRPSRGN